MHYKTRNKLKTAIKIYTVELDDRKAIEVKIQLPNREYVAINLRDIFPRSVIYRRLDKNGFDYNVETDIPIVHRPITDVKEILNASRTYNHNNRETIDSLITLLDEMKQYI